MNKRVLSLALALVLTLAVAPAVFAAETVELSDGLRFETNITITNVTRTSENPDPAEDWLSIEGFPLSWMNDEFYYDSGPKTYYAEAPVTVTLVGPVFVEWRWWGTDGTDVTDNIVPMSGGELLNEYYGGNLVLNNTGTYLLHFANGTIDDSASTFYVVVGGTASVQPTPIPAPVNPAPGSTAELKTTNGLVSAIPPAPVKDKDLAYTVQKGEALYGIAFNYYGTMQKATIDKIYAANAAYFQKTKGILEAGAVLILPAKGLINPVTQGSLDKAAGMYLVKAGDTLADIAKVYYGDAKAWTKIYEANKDRVKMVGKSPMIYEKQWLVIPE